MNIGDDIEVRCDWIVGYPKTGYQLQRAWVVARVVSVAPLRVEMPKPAGSKGPRQGGQIWERDAIVVAIGPEYQTRSYRPAK